MPTTLRPIPVPCEAARYGAPVLYLPDLWVAPDVWRGWSGFLGHRGWEGWIVPVRDLDGNIEERAAAVREFAATLPAAPILVGHGAGAVVALRAVVGLPTTAVVMLAPLLPAATSLGGPLLRWNAIWPLLTGGRVPPPSSSDWASWTAGVGGGVADGIASGLAPDSAAVLLDLARGRVVLDAVAPPVLVVSGSEDRVVSAAAVDATATRLDADHESAPGLGHWLLAGPRWERTVGTVHRWLVRQLPESMLDFYADAMAERDEADE